MKSRFKNNRKRKCLTCGNDINTGAYRCTKCSTYFCHHCYIRIRDNDPQYQCMNSSCKAYGKLMCDACSAAHREWHEPDRGRYLPPDKLLLQRSLQIVLITSLALAVVLGIQYNNIWFGLGVFIFSASIMALSLENFLLPLWDSLWREKVHRQINLVEYRYCTLCAKPLKRLEK